MFDDNICLDDECEHKRVCANHESAGDYRSEDGPTPNVSIVNNELSCNKQLTNSVGMACIRNGKIVVYSGPCYEHEFMSFKSGDDFQYAKLVNELLKIIGLTSQQVEYLCDAMKMDKKQLFKLIENANKI